MARLMKCVAMAAEINRGRGQFASNGSPFWGQIDDFRIASPHIRLLIGKTDNDSSAPQLVAHLKKPIISRRVEVLDGRAARFLNLSE